MSILDILTNLLLKKYWIVGKRKNFEKTSEEFTFYTRSIKYKIFVLNKEWMLFPTSFSGLVATVRSSNGMLIFSQPAFQNNIAR